MAEIWRDIEGYDGLYQVSNLGRVKSFHKGGRILKPTLVLGYLHVRLQRGGKIEQRKVHRLVAQAFISNPESKPEVNHVDGNKLNNHVENLDWVTPSENQRHAYDTGLQRQGEDRPDAKLTNEQARFIRENPDGLNRKQLSEMFGVVESVISAIQLGKSYRNAGGTIRKPKYPRVPDEIKQRIRAEYKFGVRGCSTHALARKFGVNQRTILNIIHEGGDDA